jgi:acetoin utilization protein AcuB
MRAGASIIWSGRREALDLDQALRAGVPHGRAGPRAGSSRERAMKVQDIMSTRVVTVEMDDKLKVVKEIFDTVKFHHLLVVEEGKLFGVVSDRDLLRALSPYIGSTVEAARDIATLNKRVHQIMKRKPVTLQPEASVTEAIALFLAHGISCIPIVDAQSRPVGIVSWRDVLRSWVVPEAAPGGSDPAPSR